ncbi:hypothetical protein [Metapseudomonas otitidis]|uniref:hypothetical protein n=1 Tax=Metapseudomonas otitidis TaxID=319939 RepID=UPI0036717834
MSESSLNIVLKSDSDQLALLLKGLNGTLTSEFLQGLEATFAGDQGHPQPAVFTNLNVQQVKVGKGLYGLHIQGDEAEALMGWLGGLPGLAFWALATSETMIDVYASSDGISYWSTYVAWEGGSDPEEDAREAKLQWWSGMTKPVLRHFDEDADSALALLKAHQKTKAEADHWGYFFANHITSEGMLLKVRIKDKLVRTAWLRELQRYVKAEEKDFQRLATYFTNERLKWQGGDETAQFPDWSEQQKAPLELANGLMFAEEAGNCLYVGFHMDGITPYIHGDCNSSPRGNYVINLVQYFTALYSLVDGRVFYKNEAHYFSRSVVDHDGYLYVI